MGAILVSKVITTGRGRGGEPTGLFFNDGDGGRLGEVVFRAVEVVWCYDVSGSMAIAFSFTLLAAIAAMMLFLLSVVQNPLTCVCNGMQ